MAPPLDHERAAGSAPVDVRKVQMNPFRNGAVRASLVLLPAVVLLSACSTDPQNVFDPRSDFTRMIADLFWQIIWAAVVVFVLVQGALVYAIIRYRRRANQGLPPQVHGNTRLEVAWTIAPALVLAWIAVPTVQTIFRTYEVPSGPDVLTIEVIGHQYWWEYRYPGGNVVTATDLHVPVGRRVVLRITSADVIHSYWVPKLAAKRDAIPGHVNTLWFTAEQTGVYEGQCAEFCSLQHANMRLRVFVDDQPTFDQWLRTNAQPAATPTSPEAQRGSQLVLQGTCAGCHAINGTNARGQIGPNLTHFASRSTIGGGIMPNTPENLDRWLENPQAIKPGNLMNVVVANPQDRQATIAYLQTLR
ncbi:MAG: cytochrome c oxidase subunit II [Dehalococcoidia bacterium]|nr:MAG: cytochrome c oxidase subunit II [Dehalococcoidia bacterium]